MIQRIDIEFRLPYRFFLGAILEEVEPLDFPLCFGWPIHIADLAKSGHYPLGDKWLSQLSYLDKTPELALQITPFEEVLIKTHEIFHLFEGQHLVPDIRDVGNILFPDLVPLRFI